jgi:hypothetical protein
MTSAAANDWVVYCVIITWMPLENTACEFLDTTAWSAWFNWLLRSFDALLGFV